MKRNHDNPISRDANIVTVAEDDREAIQAQRMDLACAMAHKAIAKYGYDQLIIETRDGIVLAVVDWRQ